MSAFIRQDFNRLLNEKLLEDIQDFSVVEIDGVMLPFFLKNSDGCKKKFVVKKIYRKNSRLAFCFSGGNEVSYIKMFQRRNIPTFDVAYYSELEEGSRLTATVIVGPLGGYQSLSELILRWRCISQDEKVKILRACGSLLGRLHAVRISHNACRMHNILIDLNAVEKAKFINLYNVRFNWMPRRSAVRDLTDFIEGFNAEVDIEVGSEDRESDSEILDRTVAIEILLVAYMNAFPMGLTMSGLKMRLTARMGKLWSQR